jgi:hypothetical protein
MTSSSVRSNTNQPVFQERRVVQANDVFKSGDIDGLVGSIVRNPGVKTALLNGWSEEEVAHFQRCLKEIIIEKYGHRDLYEFGAVANVALGVK